MSGRSVSSVMGVGALLVVLGPVDTRPAAAHDRDHDKNLVLMAFHARNLPDGAPISGRIVYDTSVPDANPDPGSGTYEGAIRLFETSLLHAANNLSVPVTQRLTVVGGSIIVGLPGDGIGHCGPTVACLAFRSPRGASDTELTLFLPPDALISDALPTELPRQATQLLIGLNGGDSQFGSLDVSLKRLRFVGFPRWGRERYDR